MATTRPLNDDHTIYVTTFFGGEGTGRCYDFTIIDNGLKIATTVTQKELVDMFTQRECRVTADDGVRPSFDRG